MSLLRLDLRCRGLRILLVEDDEDDYVFLRDLLADIDLPGHRLEWVSTYHDALEAVRERRHDLYLVDFRLGAGTGVDLLEEGSFHMATAPAIMLTGTGDHEVDERALKAGASDFLPKGEIDRRILERAIRYSLQGKRTETLQRFLSEATRVFNTSLEYSTTVGAIPRVVVPELAEWSCLYMPAQDERFRMAEVVHADPEREGAAKRLSRIALTHSPSPPVQRAMDEGNPVVVRKIHPSKLASWFDDPERRDLIDDLGVESAAVVPLQGKAGVLGVLVLVSSDPDRRYRAGDSGFFRELGRHATVALENARLFETAKAATETRDELMSMVSHDLGNPLAAISIAAGRIEHLLDDAEGDIARFTEMIRSAASSMERLLEDLLEVGRLETGHFELRRSPRPVTEILHLASQRFAPRAESQEVDFEVEVPNALPEVMVDLERIVQVLSNLLQNALQFTDPGGAIRVGVGAGDGKVEIHVSDTGSGITEEEMSHLFDRFWQSNRHRRSGAGLGLTIAKEIIEAHGGEITARSEEERGSTFAFTLPVVDASDL